MYPLSIMKNCLNLQYVVLILWDNDSEKFLESLTDKRRMYTHKKPCQAISAPLLLINSSFGASNQPSHLRLPPVPIGSLYTKLIERSCTRRTTIVTWFYHHTCVVISWWSIYVPHTVNPIRDAMMTFSDAFKKGWNRSGGGLARRQSSSKESDIHINYLILLADYFGIKVIIYNRPQ